MKRFWIFLIIILLGLNSTFAYKAYNSSYSNLTLKNNGWCVNLDVSFKVYNKTEYDLKKSDLGNVCSGNQTIKQDRCVLFQNLTPDVKVYSGPFDTMPTIFDSKADTSSNFKVTFNNSGPHLIEVTGLAKFNDYVDKTFNVINCPGFSVPISLNVSNSSNNLSIFYNQSYVLDNIKIKIKNTLINSSSNITILENLNTSDLKISKLNDSFNIFEVNFTSSNFSEFIITIPIVFENKSNVKLNYFDLALKNWILMDDFNIDKNNLTFSSSNLGYYGISEFKILKNVSSILTNISSDNLNLSNSSGFLNTTLTSSSSTTNTSIKTSSNNFKYYILGFIVILVVIFIIFFISNKNKVLPTNSSSQVDSKKVEVLNTYEQLYSHTKDYVKIYSGKYSRDQIYRALKNANIPTDIIDKVLSEEFGK